MDDIRDRPPLYVFPLSLRYKKRTKDLSYQSQTGNLVLRSTPTRLYPWTLPKDPSSGNFCPRFSTFYLRYQSSVVSSFCRTLSSDSYPPPVPSVTRVPTRPTQKFRKRQRGTLLARDRPGGRRGQEWTPRKKCVVDLFRILYV